MLTAYLTRDDWGAGPLRRGNIIDEHNFIALRVHHTVIVMPDYDGDGFLHGDIDDVKRYMKSLQAARPDLGSEVPYSFVVFPGERNEDFIVAEGRGPGVTGAHTEGQNSWTYGTALPGNYEVEDVTSGQIAGIRYCGAAFLKGTQWESLGHWQVPGQSTACPGQNMKTKMHLVQPPFTAADLSGVKEEEEVMEVRLIYILKTGHWVMQDGTDYVRMDNGMLNFMRAARSFGVLSAEVPVTDTAICNEILAKAKSPANG